MSSHFRGAILTSFLDLITCGLGAAILLFLIVVASPPKEKNSLRVSNLTVFGKVISGQIAEIAI